MARKRLPTPRELAEEAERLPSRSASKQRNGNYHHVAEIYGESETRGLTRWAKRRVLEYAR